MTIDDEFDDYEDALKGEGRRRFQLYVLIFLLAFAVTFALLWNRIVITIQSGEAGVQYRWLSGTEMNRIYGAGLHLIWPWNRMYVYNVRLQTQERNYTMLTNSGLPVELQIASVFAVTSGRLDELPVVDLRRFETDLHEHLKLNHGELLERIVTNKVAGDVADDLGAAIDEFAETFEPSETHEVEEDQPNAGWDVMSASDDDE